MASFKTGQTVATNGFSEPIGDVITDAGIMVKAAMVRCCQTALQVEKRLLYRLSGVSGQVSVCVEKKLRYYGELPGIINLDNVKMRLLLGEVDRTYCNSVSGPALEWKKNAPRSPNVPVTQGVAKPEFDVSVLSGQYLNKLLNDLRVDSLYLGSVLPKGELSPQKKQPKAKAEQRYTDGVVRSINPNEDV